MAGSSFKAMTAGRGQTTVLAWATALVLLSTSAIKLVEAHDHDGLEMPEGQYISDEPIDGTLWLHILLQITAFGIIFPAGMVLGIVRSVWHVPVQVLGTGIAVGAYFLGHMHGGRKFAKNIHSSFANSLMLLLILQIVLGFYLKLHLTRGINSRARRYVVAGHGLLGKAMPVVSWVQILFGGITAMGFCRDDHLGQCLAHFIMGSAFIAYGIMLTIILVVGQAWVRRTGRSQEFYDSMLIAVWGCVNTFTEHRWGGPWVANDIQHTTMGVFWWAAGLAGVWLSRKTGGGPQRNFIPAFVLFLTGWAMSSHPQMLEVSTMVHAAFGWTLMAAGASRIIEISLILKDNPYQSPKVGDINSFQHIPVFLLYASGFLFMGATEEQMQLISDANISHVSYVLVIYSFAFLMFLFVNMLLQMYHSSTSNSSATATKDVEHGTRMSRANGHASGADARRLRDAEEFELEGLMSDEEAPRSPSTLGKNNETTVE